MSKLPVFEMVIDESITSDVEVSFVALVPTPAIEKNFLAFNTQKLDFSINEEERIICGPAMVPDTKIYRRDDQGEYNVFFSKETIEKIRLKFFKKDYHKNLNLFHDPNLTLDGVTICDSFVSSKKRGVPPMVGFKDLPDGTWFISAKIENEEVWNKIKSGEVKGFSVEGIFSYVKKGVSGTGRHESHLIESELMADVKELIQTLKQTFIGTPAAEPAAVVAGGATPPAAAPAPAQPLNTDYTLKDGTAVSIDKLEAGGVVLVGGAPAQPGELELADGTKVQIGEGGVIATVVPASAAPAGPDFSAQFASYDEKFASYEQKFTAYEDRFAKQEAAIAKAQSINDQLFAIVQKLAEAPTADPVGEPKTSFSAQQVASKEQKRKDLAASFQKLKEKNSIKN